MIPSYVVELDEKRINGRIVLFDYLDLCEKTRRSELEYSLQRNVKEAEIYRTTIDESLLEKRTAAENRINAQDYELQLSHCARSERKAIHRKALFDSRWYRDRYVVHEEQNHEFYKILNSTSYYRPLVKLFASKRSIICSEFYFPPDDASEERLPPLPNLFYFNWFLAKSIEKYLDIQRLGVGKYLPESKSVQNKGVEIRRLSSKLLTLIEDPTVYTGPYGEAIALLLKNYTDDNSYLGGLIDEKSNFSISKYHAKAIREVLAKEMIILYNDSLLGESLLREKTNLENPFVTRKMNFQKISPQRLTIKPLKLSKRFINGKHSHPDVIADALCLITGDDNIDKRQVQRYHQEISMRKKMGDA